MLKLIASEEKNWEKLALFGIKNHRSTAVRGGGAPGAPPPGSASVSIGRWIIIMNFKNMAEGNLNSVN